MNINYKILLMIGILFISSLFFNMHAQIISNIDNLSHPVDSEEVITKYLYGSIINGGVDETIFRHCGPYSSSLEIINSGQHGFEYKITFPKGPSGKCSIRKGILNPGGCMKMEFDYAHIGPNFMLDGIGYIAIAGINGFECKSTVKYNILKE